MGSPHYHIERDRFFDRQERARLLRTCKERAELDQAKGRTTWPVRYMLVDLALFSGLRVAEIADLKVGDLVLKAENPYLIVRKGKGGRKRSVYLDGDLVRHLRRYIKQHLRSPDPQAPLFPGRESRCLPGEFQHSAAITLMKSFKRAVEEAGLPAHYSIHCARHTYATFLLADTGNLRFVQKQLGHANISMTALYADILPEQNGVLANKIRREP